MQLKHVPYCFLILAAICLAGAVSASVASSQKAPAAAPVQAHI
jgi:outer membrane lipoprotein-sorting protein